MRVAIHFIVFFVLPLVLATYYATEGRCATVDQHWGTVKSLYGAVGERGASLQGPTLENPNANPGVKPSLEALPCPDGRTRHVVEVLRLAREAYPEAELWRQPALRDGLAGERGIRDFFKWIKDHVTFSVSGFGLTIEVAGEEDNCTQFTWFWFGDGNYYLGPCL